ncbi:ribonuclease P protein component [Candidatus Saccharibacteria bacterium]|nr:ribonuclease P protein component [Candidatus Saccharibacteria bacterium]
MLAYKNRFHNRGRINYVHAHGNNIGGQKIGLVVLETPHHKTDSRFAVIVSKKVLKNAVGRNRIRRRIYEIIRLHLPKITTKADVLVRVYSKEVIDMPQKELIAELTNLLQKAHMVQ